MSCCNQCQGLENIFDQKYATRDLEDYRKNGPSRQTRTLLQALQQQGVSGLSLIDIGGGIGAIQHELFKSGISQSLDVDVSSAFIKAAQGEAERQGNAENAHFMRGDFVQLAPQIEPADIVTLDRVICCYPDMPKLVALSAQRARHLYAFVYPQDSWWMRLGSRVGNGFLWLTRDKFRFFVHPATIVDSILQDEGFKPRFHKNDGFIWQVALYAR